MVVAAFWAQLSRLQFPAYTWLLVPPGVFSLRFGVLFLWRWETFFFPPIFKYKFDLLQPPIPGWDLVRSCTSFQGILIGPNINGSNRVAYLIAETLTIFEYLYTIAGTLFCFGGLLQVGRTQKRIPSTDHISNFSALTPCVFVNSMCTPQDLGTLMTSTCETSFLPSAGRFSAYITVIIVKS